MLANTITIIVEEAPAGWMPVIVTIANLAAFAFFIGVMVYIDRDWSKRQEETRKRNEAHEKRMEEIRNPDKGSGDD